MMPLRTIPPLNILDATSNNAGIVLHLDAELNHMFFGRFQALMQFQCLKYFSAPKIFKSKNLSKLNIKVNINNAKSD